MTVAILHYHLRLGGVTRVIEGQSQALTRAGVAHVVMAGTKYRGDCDLPAVHVPGLDYRNDSSPPARPEDLFAELEAEAIKVLGAPPDVWHIHNHSLGKNLVYSAMVALLARRGTPLLLQLHDFAEDGRPDNFLALHGFDDLYPIAPHIHYALINSRDRALFQTVGISDEQTHDLPNAVTAPGMGPAGDASTSPLVLYPVRGIRRKNIGELCLIAALAPPGSRFAVSLAPENLHWRVIHDRWGAFAAEHGIPLELGVVGRIPPVPDVAPTYENWLAHCTHLVTTSIAEGFGLTFLEPIALAKPLLGRNLPEITQDFTNSGLKLGNLYDALPIPLALLDEPALREKMEDDLANAYYRFQRPLPPEIVERTWQALAGDGTIDFGNLPEPFQESVITTILRTGADFPFASWVRSALQPTAPISAPTDLHTYGLDAYQEKLLAVYGQVLSHRPSPPQFLPMQTVLTQFLKPERFHFLRT